MVRTPQHYQVGETVLYRSRNIEKNHWEYGEVTGVKLNTNSHRHHDCLGKLTYFFAETYDPSDRGCCEASYEIRSAVPDPSGWDQNDLSDPVDLQLALHDLGLSERDGSSGEDLPQFLVKVGDEPGYEAYLTGADMELSDTVYVLIWTDGRSVKVRMDRLVAWAQRYAATA